MSLVDFCGSVAMLVACAVVIVAVLLFALLGFCLVLGAADSTLNPNSAQDTARELQNATSQINAGVAGFSGAVRNTTGG